MSEKNVLTERDPNKNTVRGTRDDLEKRVPSWDILPVAIATPIMLERKGKLLRNFVRKERKVLGELFAHNIEMVIVDPNILISDRVRRLNGLILRPICVNFTLGLTEYVSQVRGWNDDHRLFSHTW